MAGGGRRRQAAAPWPTRLRWELLAWGALAAICAGLVLGLTGGGWSRAIELAALVLAACVVLTLLAAMPTKRPGGRHDGGSP